MHIHGEIFLSRCTQCPFETRDDIVVRTDDGAPEAGPSRELLPRCPSCGALLRPGVVWFGEALDPRNVARIERYFTSPIDLVIVAGTTAMFPYIVDWATRGGALVEINPEESGTTPWAQWTFRAPAAQVLPALVAGGDAI